MIKLALFALGVVTGLAFARIPHDYYMNKVFTRGDENTWPDQFYGPKYYEYKNGVKVRL